MCQCLWYSPSPAWAEEIGKRNFTLGAFNIFNEDNNPAVLSLIHR